MKVAIVSGDDWMGLYIDGKLVLEGHSLCLGEVLEAVGIKPETITPDNEWLENEGNLPKDLAKVKT